MGVQKIDKVEKNEVVAMCNLVLLKHTKKKRLYSRGKHS